jgi:histidinol-phosphate aminotransferase
MSSPIRQAVLNSPAYPFSATYAQFKLDQNENPRDFPAHLKSQVLERLAQTPWNRYPDLNADSIKASIAAFEDWDVNGIVATTGSNVLIGLITELAGIGQKVVTVKPNFSLYALEANLLDADLREVPLKEDFSLDYAGLARELESGAGLLYLPQPHAPTGSLEERGALEAFLATVSRNWIVILDEAYHQFSGTDYRDLVRQNPNFISLRTFSKAWGLAGVRLGYALCHPTLALELQKLVPPFGASPFHALTVQVALENPQFMFDGVAQLVAERERMFAALKDHAVWTFYPSHTNFFLFRTPDAQAAYQFLLERSILVRKQNALHGLEGCLRVTVGTPLENDAFLNAALEVTG